MLNKEFSVLIGDDTAAYGVRIANILKLSGCYAYTRKNNSEEILDAIISEKPDIVFMDFKLSDSDAASLITKAKTFHRADTEFIVASEENKPLYKNNIAEAGGLFLMAGHEDAENISSVIMLLIRRMAVEKKPDVNEMATNLIRNYGIPSHVKGYAYLKSAIVMAVENSNLMLNLSKSLYPSVAEAHDTNASSVERSIRTAIEIGWNKSFYSEKDSEHKINKPTCAEFISDTVEALKMHCPTDED